MKISTTISIEDSLLKKARKIAKTQRRSFSAQVEKWIEEKLSEKIETTPESPATR